MKAEIISVGTELLLGHVINSDAALVARELAACGIDLAHAQVVGDNSQRLAQALAESATRCDIIITTGGLGPTKDDLTKETVATFTNRRLVRDESAFAALQEYFGEREMTENQLKQALVPCGATVFANPHGTAPGMAVPFGEGKFVILLPGPPRELEPMLATGLRPFLQKLEHKIIVSTMVKTFGIGEGAAAEKLGELLMGANPTVAPYASGGEMFVKITAKADDEAEARALLEPVAGIIRNRLGDVVYGCDVPSLEHVVVKLLLEKKQSVATAESCTGGLLAKRITDQPGASEIFGLGLVVYSNEAKKKLLNVPEGVLRQYGAVSPQVAKILAENVCALAGATWGIGITGIAGPGGGTPEKPVGLVYLAVASEEGSLSGILRPQGRYLGREWVRSRAASLALDMLRRQLLGLPQAAVF